MFPNVDFKLFSPKKTLKVLVNDWKCTEPYIIGLELAKPTTNINCLPHYNVQCISKDKFCYIALPLSFR